MLSFALLIYTSFQLNVRSWLVASVKQGGQMPHPKLLTGSLFKNIFFNTLQYLAGL